MSDINFTIEEATPINFTIEEATPINFTITETGPQGVPGEGVPVGGTTGQALVKIDGTDYNTEWSTINSAEWGSITGTLSSQTDLQNALNDKYDASNPDGFITSYTVTNSDLTGLNISELTNDTGYITSQLTTEEVQDIAGPLVATGGTKTLITVTYDDINNNMDFVVNNDLSLYDNSTSGFITDYTVTEGDVTQHEAALSITESQISDFGTYLTGIADESVTEAKLDVSNTPTDEYVLSYDSSTGRMEWVAQSGGGGSPGGSDTHVQFNDAGSFGGTADLAWNSSSLTVNGHMNFGGYKFSSGGSNVYASTGGADGANVFETGLDASILDSNNFLYVKFGYLRTDSGTLARRSGTVMCMTRLRDANPDPRVLQGEVAVYGTGMEGGISFTAEAGYKNSDDTLVFVVGDTSDTASNIGRVWIEEIYCLLPMTFDATKVEHIVTTDLSGYTLSTVAFHAHGNFAGAGYYGADTSSTVNTIICGNEVGPAFTSSAAIRLFPDSAPVRAAPQTVTDGITFKGLSDTTHPTSSGCDLAIEIPTSTRCEDPVEVIRFQAEGNIGINQTTPTEKLHVAGNVYIEDGELIMDSPTKQWRITVDDNGNLTTEEIV